MADIEPALERKKVYIVGASRQGRDTLTWATDAGWNVVGFLDSRSEILAGFGLSVNVVGEPDTFVPSEEDAFVCAVGESDYRLTLCRQLEAKGFRFVTIIHPLAYIGPRVTIGEGSVICPFATVTGDATIGKHCLLNVHATVTHDTVLGDGCTLSDYADVCGRAVLGEGVFMGSHASVLPGIRIGKGTVLGAGAIANRDLDPGVTAVGVPARAIGSSLGSQSKLT